MLTTTYYYEDGTEAGKNVDQSHRTKDSAILNAQKQMAQLNGVVVAHVEDDATVTVVSKATEWQKRNG